MCSAKRIVVFVLVLLFLPMTLPLYAFADVVEFNEAAKLGATIVDLYGAANNTSLAFDTVTDSSALTVIETLYQDYSSSASDPYTLAAIGAAAAAAGTIAVVYDAITGQGYVQLYQEQYISSLDGFWDYTLSDLGLSRNLDGLFEWSLDQNNSVSPISVSVVPGSFYGQPAPYLSSSVAAELYASSSPLLTTSTTSCRFCSKSVDVPVYAFFYTTANSKNLVFCTSVSSGRALRVNLSNNNSYSTSGPYTLITRYSDNLYYYTDSGWGSATALVPVYSTINEGLSDVQSLINGVVTPGLSSGAVFLEPEFYIGDPLTAVPTIEIPNVSDPNYLPQPLRINTGIEWDPLWGDPVPGGSQPEPGVPYPVTDPSILNDAVPEIWKRVVNGTDVSPEPDPDPDPGPSDPDGSGPDEVFNPLLPVTLPSFNFNFSGIWHYVRDWVSSIGAWLALLFTIYSNLPYAIVVPIYASIVILIVLGVYKRFFM